MEDGPPTDHVLRPHHITLLIILSAAFRDFAIQKLPKAFALHIHRVLLNEVSEIAQPKAHKEILTEVCSGPSSDKPECENFKQEIVTTPATVLVADKMGDYIAGTISLCNGGKNDEVPKLQRRSIFGFFCRRCQTTFAKLSATGLLKLCQDYQAWCEGDGSAGYFMPEKDELTCNLELIRGEISAYHKLIADLLLFKTLADKKSWARPQYYEKWQDSLTTGDEKTGVENLRRFFEQHFHDSNDSGYRHHALLELIRLHYINGEYSAARKLLAEAIDAARTIGDRIILHHCLSILHRLPNDGSQRPNLQEIQPDLHPFEVLYDTCKLLDEDQEQPLGAAFRKIIQAIGLYDLWVDMQAMPPTKVHQMAQHTVQSIVWREVGCQGLCRIEENIVLVFLESGGDNSTRLVVSLNQAYATAREGRYDEALALLLRPDIWQGLTIHDFQSWSHQIWYVLVLRTIRRGQFRLYREFLLPMRPVGFNSKHFLFDVEDNNKLPPISESLYQLLRLRERDQVTSGVEHLLKALWQSEFLCKLGLYRTCVILLADIGLEFGMSKRSRQVLEDIMPQLINNSDLEQRAVGCFTFARCIIAAGDSTSGALNEALPYLHMAEADFRTLELHRSARDVQYFQSVVYHNLGMTNERDDAAMRHSQTEEYQRKLEAITFDETYQAIFHLTAKIGAALASQ